MLAGLVLAGGRSSRFGSDKAAAMLHGKSLLELGVDALKAHCGAVAVSARAGSAGEVLAQDIGLPVLTDMVGDGDGPLAGVRAGLIWAQGLGAEALAVRPVDAPFLPDDLVEQLMAVIGDAPAALAVSANGPEPLCSLWTLKALHPLTAALADGNHPAVHRFLDEIGAARWDAPDPAAFANVNTPEEMAKALARPN